jgi:hypothetical protein
MMLVAHLRGLLNPAPAYGLRSLLAEDAVIEGLTADDAATSYFDSVSADASMLPALTKASAQETMRLMRRKTERGAELRAMEIFHYATKGGKDRKAKPSLYQLYRIAEEHGIFDALRTQGSGEGAASCMIK